MSKCDVIVQTHSFTPIRMSNLSFMKPQLCLIVSIFAFHSRVCCWGGGSEKCCGTVATHTPRYECPTCPSCLTFIVLIFAFNSRVALYVFTRTDILQYIIAGAGRSQISNLPYEKRRKLINTTRRKIFVPILNIPFDSKTIQITNSNVTFIDP